MLISLIKRSILALIVYGTRDTFAQMVSYLRKNPPQVSFFRFIIECFLFIRTDSCQECGVILTLEIFPFFLHKLSHLNAYFVVRPLSPDRLPSSDEKSDPFLFQSMFSLLISAFVVLTDSVSLYGFYCIFHTLHGN